MSTGERNLPIDPDIKVEIVKVEVDSGPVPSAEEIYNEIKNSEISKARAAVGHLVSWRLAKALPNWLLWPVVKKWSGETLPPDPKIYPGVEPTGGPRIVKMIRTTTRRPQ